VINLSDQFFESIALRSNLRWWSN